MNVPRTNAVPTVDAELSVANLFASAYPNTKAHLPQCLVHYLKIHAITLPVDLTHNAPSYLTDTQNVPVCRATLKAPTQFVVVLNHVTRAILTRAVKMQSVTRHEIQFATVLSHMLVIHSVHVKYPLLYQTFVHQDLAVKMPIVTLSTDKNNAIVDRATLETLMLGVENHHDQSVNRIHVDQKLNVLFYQAAKLLVSVLTVWEAIHRQQLDVMATNVALMKNVAMIRPVLDYGAGTLAPEHAELMPIAELSAIIQFALAQVV